MRIGCCKGKNEKNPGRAKTTAGTGKNREDFRTVAARTGSTIQSRVPAGIRRGRLHVHFDAVVFATALIRVLESAAIGRAGEGEEFVEAVAEAAQRAVGSIDGAVGPASLAAVSSSLRTICSGISMKP